mmetsp:Transcript_24095/g.18383  ORF Transcript_24095/g.18383 Transcript_24095/m.18383 type:complete len:97 (-) Transcript_24095:30-320(-)
MFHFDRVPKSSAEKDVGKMELNVYLNEDGKACGFIYFDDGESFEYEKGKASILELVYSKEDGLKVEFQKDELNLMAKLIGEDGKPSFRAVNVFDCS